MTTTGCQVLLDLHGCDVTVLTDVEGLRGLGIELWRAAMEIEAPGEPLVVRLASGAEGSSRRGVVSLVGLAAGASIVAHFSESDATAAINVYSRDGVDAAGAEAVARERLRASDCERRVITGRVSHL